jgi:hypothetical protein
MVYKLSLDFMKSNKDDDDDDDEDEGMSSQQL